MKIGKNSVVGAVIIGDGCYIGLRSILRGDYKRIKIDEDMEDKIFVLKR